MPARITTTTRTAPDGSVTTTVSAPPVDPWEAAMASAMQQMMQSSFTP